MRRAFIFKTNTLFRHADKALEWVYDCINFNSEGGNDADFNPVLCSLYPDASRNLKAAPADDPFLQHVRYLVWEKDMGLLGFVSEAWNMGTGEQFTVLITGFDVGDIEPAEVVDLEPAATNPFGAPEFKLSDLLDFSRAIEDGKAVAYEPEVHGKRV